MGAWGSWREDLRAATSWPADGGVTVRMATDCTGLAVPELALRAYGNLHGVRTEVAWCCDNHPACLEFAKKNLRPNLQLSDMLDRQFQADSFLTATQDGRRVLVSQDEVSLDLYVAGTMCTPFSPKGARGGFADPKAKTFFQFFKTLATMRPRVAVLENSTGILNKRNRAQLLAILKTTSGYARKVYTLRTSKFKLPQHRVRAYLVLLRRDAVRLPVDQAFRHIQRSLAQVQAESTPPFPEFFETVGESLRARRFPATPMATYVTRGDHGDRKCKCAASSLCTLHRCSCSTCHRAGRPTLACKWRRHVKTYLAGKTKAKLQYLRMWRSIQKDPALKEAPDYFDLAAKRGINLCHLTSPRERTLLRSLSQHQNLHKPSVVVDISQSVHRACFRTDGLVPALGTGCGRVMATGYGTLLTSDQCLWLQGVNPAGIILDGISEQDRYRMAGNAMSLPVVGAVIVAALSTLKWT